ncbi:MAG TPA: hypothetical protein VGP72_20120 [Planctomycetota bacterium]|jgi:hypothetical protein
MPTKTSAARRSPKHRRFPVRCKTWAQVEEIQRQYLKPVRYGPKGQPIYDFEEVARYVIFPQDT